MLPRALALTPHKHPVTSPDPRQVLPRTLAALLSSSGPRFSRVPLAPADTAAALASGSDPLPPLPQPWARVLPLLLGSASPFEATSQPSSGPPKAADLRPEPRTGAPRARRRPCLRPAQAPRWSPGRTERAADVRLGTRPRRGLRLRLCVATTSYELLTLSLVQRFELCPHKSSLRATTCGRSPNL